VEDVVAKYEWAKEANRRVMKLKEEGKPLPKSLDEVEAMMGGRWSAAASVNLAKTGQLSRNAACPCGSGKKYKRCVLFLSFSKSGFLCSFPNLVCIGGHKAPACSLASCVSWAPSLCSNWVLRNGNCLP
jgi:hypothetical protein